MSSFEVYLDHETKLVKINAFGEFFQEDGEKIITAARTTATEYGYNIFYDFRQATTTVNLASWFNLPRDLEVFKKTETRRAKAVVLVAKTDKAVEGYKFFETVTENVGINFRVFFNEVEAIEWVTGKSLSAE